MESPCVQRRLAYITRHSSCRFIPSATRPTRLRLHNAAAGKLLRLKYILKLKFDMLRIYISKKRSVILFSLVQSLIQAIADENWFSQFFKT